MKVQSPKSKVQSREKVGGIFVHGLGAVSPAGWGVANLRDALKNNLPIPTQTLARPGWEKPLQVRAVPPPVSHPAFFSHPRLRRANSIAQYTVAAALEALGDDVAKIQAGELRLGIVVCVMAGGVNYSRRFYEEVLRDPATASPLIFPETVFNAPASHLAAFLGTNAASYTLVGDDGTFMQGLALAAQWLGDDKMDECVVVGAEETDWIVADAMKLFQRAAVHGAGAGAVLLKKNPGGAFAELSAVTDSFPFTQTQTRADAARKMRAQLSEAAPDESLCIGEMGKILGEAFVASAAWQCIAACDNIRRKEFAAANVGVVGTNQQAIGARFLTCADLGAGRKLCLGKIGGGIFFSMNDSTELKAQIKLMLVENLMLKISAAEIGDDQPLFGPGSLGLDSVDALQLVVALDKNYGMKLSDTEVARKTMQTVNTIAAAIESR